MLLTALPPAPPQPNTVILGVPNGNVLDPNFGKITGSASGFPNRQIQLGGRLLL